MKHTINLYALQNGEMVEFLDLLLIKSDPGAAAAVPDRYRTTRTQIATVHQQLKEAYARDRKSELTDIILEADARRDDRLVELFGIVRTFQQHPTDASIRNAANSVYKKISAYGTATEISRDDIMTESATIDKILADLRSPVLAPQVALLPIAPWIDALEQENGRAQQAYIERGDERAVQEAGAFKKLRRQAVKAIRALIDRIGLYGEDADWATPWKDIHDRVRELCKDFDWRIAQRTALAGKEPEPSAN